MISAAYLLQSRGIRLSALQYTGIPPTGEAQITGVSVPSSQALGDVYQAVVYMYSNKSMKAKLHVYEDDKLLQTSNIQLKAGSSSSSVRIVPSSEGDHIITAVLEADEDTIFENNTFSAVTTITTSRRILLVDGTGKETGPLAALLGQAGYEVDISTAGNIPRTISAMCKYGMIVLMNVDKKDMPTAVPDVLNEYVTVYGRSLVTTGGENTYIYGHMLETAIDTLLPVNMEIRTETSEEPIALMLVLDCSASMGNSLTHMHADALNPAEMAKRGAVKCVSSLHINDYAGILAFSDACYVLSPLTSMANSDQIIQAISRMGTIGGTMYTDALQEAYDQLTAFEGDIRKHVIFISDGNPADSD